MPRRKMYVYVRCDVGPQNPAQYSLLQALIEKAGIGTPVDVIPPVSAGCLSFSHITLEADSVQDAYEKGYELLREPSIPNSYCHNSYAFEMPRALGWFERIQQWNLRSR